MKLGFLTPFSKEIVEFAGKGPFDCLELGGVPKEWLGNTDEAIKARESAKKILKDNNIFVASILSPMPSIRTTKEELKGRLEAMGLIMDVCKDLGGAVYTGAGPSGYDTSKSLQDNVSIYKEVYSHVAELAEQKGIKVAFENWPGGKPFGEGANLPITPYAWELMFNALPSDYIGLEFDPSHLMWQWIDPYKAVRDFAKHIFMVHLKDTQIFYDRLAKVGNHGSGWWTYRLPGFGELNWHKFFTVLYEFGYKGNMVIEHEDPIFSGDRRNEGFIIGGNYLRKVLLV
ncbi:TPA: sugar phosphate isomerase/epimerase [Candidatus Poribacteria bacterium]|nr:sugar phosphate isomerase/epimerase [Candidatus Poribacteria bacterium]